MCIVLHKGGLTWAFFFLSSYYRFTYSRRSRTSWSVRFQAFVSCKVNKRAKTVTKLANMKQLSDAIHLMVLDLAVIYLVIHCYDTETFLSKPSLSPYV